MGKFRPRKRRRNLAKTIAIVVVVAVVIVLAAAASLFYLYAPAAVLTQQGNVTTSRTTSYASSLSTSTVKSTTISTSTSITTSIGHASPLTLPEPYPSSQIVRMGANTTVSDAGASGGTSPYRYQWLGAVSNTTSNFTASFGDFVCLNTTAQSTTCNFQTVSGYNTLLPGIYYLKLHVSDSSFQPANSSIVYVDVIS